MWQDITTVLDLVSGGSLLAFFAVGLVVAQRPLPLPRKGKRQTIF